MQITKAPGRNPRKTPVGEITPGTPVMNGEGNLCMVCRSGDVGDNKIRLVNLENGGTYTVKDTCEYEMIEANVIWSYLGS